MFHSEKNDDEENEKELVDNEKLDEKQNDVTPDNTYKFSPK